MTKRMAIILLAILFSFTIQAAECVMEGSPPANTTDRPKNVVPLGVVQSEGTFTSQKCGSLLGLETDGFMLASSCCKVCSKGKACGDSCISRDKDCHKPPGCACDG